MSAQLPSSGNAKRSSPVALVPRAERLVEHGERRVDQRHGVAGDEHEAIAEGLPRLAQVPAHARREAAATSSMCTLERDAAGMAALAVVEREVDALVDEVLDDLVALEIALGGAVQGVDAAALSSTPWQPGCYTAAIGTDAADCAFSQPATESTPPNVRDPATCRKFIDGAQPTDPTHSTVDSTANGSEPDRWRHRADGRSVTRRLQALSGE